ncbi:hypothetical protein BKA70DRAFT_1510021 [Coprinopsis sp. MPI-PUGE-AT-0042]|nr:hypothetical protein BKA70DRAFT_1510021 [Coprinopsis sp. MPI-PUGE-AT-0042]
MNPSPVQNASRMLDVEIATLTSHLVEVKRVKNTSARISCLPAEILCRIFVRCRDGWPAKRGAKMAWVVITHVCHAWRVLALDYSSLWGDLDSTVGYKWFETLLQRVGKSAISLTIDYKGGNGFRHPFSARRKALLAAALSRTAQLVEVNLESNSPEALQQVLEQMTNPAEKLQVLKIDNPMPLRTRVRLPQAFLANKAPRLTRLDLRNVDIAWDSTILQGLANLRYLSVTMSSSRPNPIPTVEALQAMTHLEDLVLFIPKGGGQVSRSPPTSLPGLKSLSLFGSCQDCAQFLLCLKLPGCTTMRLLCQSDTDTSELCGALESSWVSPSGSSPIANNFTTLKLGLRTSTNSLTWVASSDMHELNLDLHISGDHSPIILIPIHPLQNIKNLHIEFPGVVDIALEDVFARLSSVEFLEVKERMATEATLQALTKDPAFDRDPHKEGARIALLPNLKWIEVRSTPFNSGASTATHHGMWFGVDYGKFEDPFLRRFAHGAWSTLEEISFVDCIGLDEQDMTELEASVYTYIYQTETKNIRPGCECSDVKCPGCESDFEDFGV